MTAYDLKNSLTLTSLQVPVAKTATFTATGDIDLKGYVGSVMLVQDVGTVSGTSPTLDGKLQTSTDDSTYADITGATYTQVTATGSLQSIAVDVRSVNRYVRYVGTIGGTSPSFIVSVTVIGQKSLV